MASRRKLACWAVAVLATATATIAPTSAAQAAVTGDTTLLSVTSAGAIRHAHQYLHKLHWGRFRK